MAYILHYQFNNRQVLLGSKQSDLMVVKIPSLEPYYPQKVWQMSDLIGQIKIVPTEVM